MSWFKKINFVLLLFVVFSARGEEPLTIEQAVSEALNANPALKAKEAEVKASKARIGIARSLDDPMVGVEFEDVPIDTVNIKRGMETNYSVIQKFPFPSKLITQGRVAKNSFRAEESNYEWGKVNLVVETEHAFHDLYFIEKSLVINRELRGLWQTLSASEKGRYETGNGGAQNFLKAKVESEKLESEGELLEAKKIEMQARLNVLLGRDIHQPIALAQLPKHNHPFPPYAELEKRVLERHPELKMAQYGVATSKSNLSLARQQTLLPDFQTRFTYGQRYGLQDTWTGEAMITIPFLWGKNRKAIQEAKAMERMAGREKENVQNERLAMLKESYARLESTKRIYDLYTTKILPNATVAVKGVQAGYQTGKVMFIDAIDTAREFQEAKFKTLEAFVDYHEAITHLKLAVGENWER